MILFGCVLLQHPELCGDRAVPVWNGSNDHAADTAQGHCTIQPDGRFGKYCKCYHLRWSS